jgi:NAD(P)-dependent dehydrogenase (short-subunit alcohol dehydrogenase family)
MPGKLDGKVALITGGGSGIGMATAREFASEGAQVYITGRRKPELDAAAAALGSGVTAIQGDVTKPKDLDRIYGQIGQEKGHVDIVFANAGVADFAPIGSITDEHFDKVFGINVKGAMLTAQKALPLMPDGGTIILTGSEASIKGFGGTSIYSATKAAVRSFARTWTTDLKDRGIRVNVVSPGPIDTPMASESFADRPGAFEKIIADVASRRLGRPEEPAKAVAFLASDDASFMTGEEVFVDGGAAQV